MTTSDTPLTDKAIKKFTLEAGQKFETFYVSIDDACTIEKELRAQLAANDAALAVLIAALRIIADDTKDIVPPYRSLGGSSIVTDIAAKALVKLPESAKQYTKVIEAARELSGEWEQGAQPSVEMFRELCQAVRDLDK